LTIPPTELEGTDMHSQLTELMMRERAAQLHRRADEFAVPHDEAVTPSTPPQPHRTGLTSLWTRLSLQADRRRYRPGRSRLT
jgi:hypothetical protein